jgi:hypothetical protein
MDITEKNLYETIEEVTKKTSQELSLMGQSNPSKNLKSILRQAFVTDKKRFEDSYRKVWEFVSSRSQWHLKEPANPLELSFD